jgi:hypothetical protein
MLSYWDRAVSQKRHGETREIGVHILGRRRDGSPIYSIGGGAAAPVATPLQNPDVQPRTSQQAVEFRRATIERAQIMPVISGSLSPSLQPEQSVVEGSGYMFGIVARMHAVGDNVNNVVAFNEDGPYNVLDSVIVSDTNGQLLVLSGYSLYLVSLAMRQWGIFPPTQAVDPNFNLAPITGAGATAGSFDFTIRVPVGVNRRDLVGILGNQDRAQKYFLTTNIAAASQVMSVQPNNGVTFALHPYYENYSVPMPMSAQGQPQEIYPPSFGTLHFLTETISDASPQPGVVNHYIRRLGNTVRFFMLVFRSNGSRASAEANPPTNIQLNIGNDTVFNEDYAYRRFLMYERYGIVFPPGVLVYDAMHDFEGTAGYEMGDDYYHTQAVQTAQFQITYPDGFGSTNNSLRIITADLQRVGAPQR